MDRRLASRLRILELRRYMAQAAGKKQSVFLSLSMEGGGLEVEEQISTMAKVSFGQSRSGSESGMTTKKKDRLWKHTDGIKNKGQQALCSARLMIWACGGRVGTLYSVQGKFKLI